MVRLAGPPGSPYEGGLFLVEIQGNGLFPFNAPVLTFHTKIFHHNVAKNGMVSLPILKDNEWSAEIKLADILQQLKHIMMEPSMGVAFDEEAAQLFEVDPDAAAERAKELTQNFASEG